MIIEGEFRVIDDKTTNQLYRRYLACYMIHDDNPNHADRSFYLNSIEWEKETQKRVMKIHSNIKNVSEDEITAIFNQIVAENIESWIDTHIENWPSRENHPDTETRAAVEVEMAKIMATFD